MQFWILFKKELLNLVRDKKAFIVLFLPLLLFPLIYFGLGSQLKDVEKSVGNEIKVYCNIQSDKEKKEYFQQLLADVNIAFIEAENPEEALKEEKIYLIVDFAEGNIEIAPISVQLTYNSNSNYSTAAYSLVISALEKVNTEIMCQKLLDIGVDLSVTDNVRLSVKEISTNMILVMLAPMLITCLLVSGGASVAVDIFAGEKERGTLEQLAVTQVKRGSLLIAKTLIVLLVTLLNAVISIVAYYLSMKISPEITKMFGGGEISVALSFEAVLYLIVTILTFSLLISSLLIFMSLRAKSIKEAQAGMSLLTILPSIFSLLVMFSPMSKISGWGMAIPIYNVLVGLKMIFADTLVFPLLFVMIGSQLLLALIINIVSWRMVRDNKFLL